MFSRSWQYAMRILLHLARLEPGAMTNAAKIAAATRVPPPYAAKILSTLAGRRLIRSRRGPKGGVMLARRAREISLLDVAAAVGEAGVARACFLGFRECNDDQPCPLHPIWKGMRTRIVAAMLERSLADFALPSVAAAAARKR